MIFTADYPVKTLFSAQAVQALALPATRRYVARIGTGVD
jgi:hypothetical protein